MNLYKNKSFIRTFDIIGYVFVFLFGISLFSSCDSSKFLTNNNYLIGETEWVIEGNISKKVESKLTQEVINISNQKENRNWLFFIPREYIYYKSSAPEDTSWYKNSVRKYIAEPPAIYNEEKTKLNAKAIQNFLINKKGFYNARVNYKVNKKDRHKKAEITYKINLNNQYFINKINYACEDKKLLKIIESTLGDALINVGDPIDEVYFNLEKSRISNQLQNKGYLTFNSKYIQVKGDSTNNKNAIDILMSIKLPPGQSEHLVYTIGEINIHMDYNQTENISVEEPYVLDHIRYFKKSDDFLIRPKRMNRFIYMRPGEIYNNFNKQKTYRKLAQLSPYQFINLNTRLDKENHKVNFDIYLTPFQHKWTNSVGGDIYYSNSTNNKIGLSANKEFINRNLFHGAERFFINFDASLEFEYKDKKWVTHQDFNIQSKTEIPDFVDFTGELSLLKTLRIITPKRYQSILEETNTEVKAGYTYLNLIDFYRYHRFNLSTGYAYQPNINKRWYYEPISFTVFNPFPSKVLLEIWESLPLVKKSLSKSFISGLLFSNLTFTNNRSLRNGQHIYWYSKLELSGFENHAYNMIAKAINKKAKPWNEINGLEFSRFVKLEMELRFSQRLSEKSVFASRVNIGAGTSFGNSQTIPFIKQFFIGGPNSIRAWSERELGPGEYLEQTSINSFYQAGDALLEANIEYRYDILDISSFRLELATFLDAGNIWTLQNDPKRIGTALQSNFYNQIALGAGYGLRFDFDFFLLRFDMAYKLRNPYKDHENGSYWYTHNPFLGNLNIAINHPF